MVTVFVLPAAGTFRSYRARRADRQALTAGGANRLRKGSVHECADAAGQAGAEEVDRADELGSVLAPLGAPAAQDAVPHRNIEHGAAAVHRLAVSAVPAAAVDVMMPGGHGELPVVLRAVAVDHGHPSARSHPAGRVPHPGNRYARSCRARRASCTRRGSRGRPRPPRGRSGRAALGPMSGSLHSCGT